MRRFRCRFAITLAVLALAATTPARATGGWTSPVDGAEIITPYAAVYAGKTHRGVDIAAAAGSAVGAPADGQVVFAGRVPADGGGTCGAVTIELADGLRVSCLPLAEVFVGQGVRVSASEAVGILAASGDDSSPEPHLHLGLRRGDEYLDPTGLLPDSEPVEPVSLPGPPTGAAGSRTTRGDGSPAGSTAIADPVAAPAQTHVTAAGHAPVAASVSAVAAPVSRPAPIRHAVPEAAGVPAASQVIVGPAVAAPGLRVSMSSIVGAAPVSVALVAPGVLLVLVGAFGLTRQFAHGSIR